jgi:hypothetical protein
LRICYRRQTMQTKIYKKRHKKKAISTERKILPFFVTPPLAVPDHLPRRAYSQ